jgi:hypothetical protein
VFSILPNGSKFSVTKRGAFVVPGERNIIFGGLQKPIVGTYPFFFLTQAVELLFHLFGIVWPFKILILSQLASGYTSN